MKRGIPLLNSHKYDLSVIIPARNEIFLSNTINDILKNKRGNTEVIAILDGYWPEPGIQDHPDVTLIHHPVSIGQRAATNEGARISNAKFIMKADAHCAFDEGFDIKLMQDCEYDWTVIPRMYNLHAFDWECKKCGHRVYQGPKPDKCEKCKHPELERKMVWKPRKSRKSDSMRFDTNMKFAYWGSYTKRAEAKPKIAPLLCAIGACWFLHRDRFWDLDGLDEGHGSWGQMGVEIACKSWLSGGKHLINKKTWFSHMFRTGKGFGFPYKISGKQVNKARKHSQKLWKGNTWPKAKHDLDWLLTKFHPIPEWHDDKQSKKTGKLKRGIVYYTDNQAEERFFIAGRKILESMDLPIISVSQHPIDFGKNYAMDLDRSNLSMFRQILTGLQKSDADIVYLCEHDVLYHESHFNLIPEKENIFYYNQNRWAVDTKTGQAVHYLTKCPSHLVAFKSTLIDYYTKRLAMVEKDGFKSKVGYAPPRGIESNSWKVKTYMSEQPNVDLRHDKNLSGVGRFKKEDFSAEWARKGWKESDTVPYWGKTKGCFEEFLRGISKGGAK